MPTTICVYCREVAADEGYDRCTACRTWRDEEWCEAHGVEHGVEPQVYAPSVGKYEGLWVMENQAGLRWLVLPPLPNGVPGGKWSTAESGEFTSWTDTELEAEGLDSDHLDDLSTKYVLPAGTWININES